MSGYRVIGIDPALTATGLCVLESAGPGDYRVTASTTIKTHTKQDMLTRLDTIRCGVGAFIQAQPGLTPVIIEDPTSRSGTASRAVNGKNPRSIMVTGLAVGISVSTVLCYRPIRLVNFIPPDEWMPRTRSGNLEHIMANGVMTRMLMGFIKFPGESTTEHEVMAAGVARYWIEQERMSQRMRVGA